MESQSGFELYIKSPEGFELAYRVALADVPEGTTMADALSATCAHLAANGFVRSERLDKPARGGGGNPNWKPREEKPDVPAPEGVTPPIHCGQPMRFKRWPNKQDSTKINEAFECRAGKDCPDANQYGGKTIWLNQWLRQQPPQTANGVPDENPFTDDPIRQFV